MKNILPRLTMKVLVAGFILFTTNVFGGTFTSNIASGNWNNPASWTFAGDADGIPDSDDDVTITAGQQINLTTNSNSCRDLIVAGTLRGTNASFVVNIYGDYTLTGSESGSYVLGFRKLNGTVSGAGIYATGVTWQFANNTTIAASVNVTKNVKCRVVWGKTVTNLGNFTLNTLGIMSPDSPTSKWVNGTGGGLTLNTSNFMVGAISDFSTNANSLVIRYTGNLPTVVGNEFSSLTINQNTTTLLMDLVCSANLTVNGTGTLVTSGFDIHCEGDFAQAATGVLTMSGGDVLFMDGTAAQTMGTAASVTIPNLTIDNAAGVTATSGTYVITEALTLNDGLLDVTAAASFTLRSDAAGTARIAPVSNGTISSNVTVERYIDARSAGYSDMASPLTGTTFQDWDDELIMIYGYVPPSEYPSCWGYDESLWDYVPITAATTAITSGVGYEVYLDSDGGQTTFNATTINSIGTPTIGPVNISGNLTRDNDGWNLVGNPYAAFLDFNAFQTSSAGTISGTWMYYDEGIADFVSTAGGTIAPHQGFWIEVLSVPATATFTEVMKDPSNSSSFRNSAHEYFGLRLKSENKTNFTSNTHFSFDNYYSENYEPGVDVTFIKVPHPDAPALYTHSAEGKNLRVNVFNKKEEWDIPVYCKVGKDDFYTISVQNIDFATADGYSCVILEDKKTGTFTDLSTGDYRFFAKPGDQEDRFVLHLKQGDCKFAGIESGITEDGIEVSQQTEGTFVNFELEETADCIISVYNPLGQMIAEPVKLTAGNQRVRLNVPDDYSGIMVVSVQMDNKNITKKIFK